uniref:Uncharacterized protein n=1 Tax=Acrobeloides nanus TaxID=290746 RepID=A0A914D008_9BILA
MKKPEATKIGKEEVEKRQPGVEKTFKEPKAIESLKRDLIKAWNEITLEQLASIIDNFSERLKACVEAKGGHFE